MTKLSISRVHLLAAAALGVLLIGGGAVAQQAQPNIMERTQWDNRRLEQLDRNVRRLERALTQRNAAGQPVLVEPDPEVVAAMRTGQERTEAAARDERGRPALRPTDPTTAIAVLRDAAADRRAVWVGYADSAGAVSRILFHPERIEGGRILGRADGSPRTLSVHRITAAAWE